MKFIIVIGFGIMWACICGDAMKRKGYEPEVWYVLGFIFGLFAFLATLFFERKNEKYGGNSIQDIVREEQESRRRTNVSEGHAWMCTRCRRTNMNSVETCACGAHRPAPVSKVPYSIMQYEMEKQSAENWTCQKCGKKNTGHIFICSCGCKKSESEQMERDVTVEEQLW